MKFATEFRDPKAAKALLAEIAQLADTIGATRDTPVAIMEICGGHTHSIFRYGLDKLVHEGLLQRSHGRGTFVRRPNFDGSFFRFFRQVDAAGNRTIPESRVLSRTLETVKSPVAQALAFPAPPLHSLTACSYCSFSESPNMRVG